jgi:hypothetical protein
VLIGVKKVVFAVLKRREPPASPAIPDPSELLAKHKWCILGK